jgi:hypothetical protein
LLANKSSKPLTAVKTNLSQSSLKERLDKKLEIQQIRISIELKIKDQNWIIFPFLLELIVFE